MGNTIISQKNEYYVFDDNIQEAILCKTMHDQNIILFLMNYANEDEMEINVSDSLLNVFNAANLPPNITLRIINTCEYFKKHITMNDIQINNQVNGHVNKKEKINYDLLIIVYDSIDEYCSKYEELMNKKLITSSVGFLLQSAKNVFDYRNNIFDHMKIEHYQKINEPSMSYILIDYINNGHLFNKKLYDKYRKFMMYNNIKLITHDGFHSGENSPYLTVPSKFLAIDTTDEKSRQMSDYISEIEISNIYKQFANVIYENKHVIDAIIKNKNGMDGYQKILTNYRSKLGRYPDSDSAFILQNEIDNMPQQDKDIDEFIRNLRHIYLEMRIKLNVILINESTESEEHLDTLCKYIWIKIQRIADIHIWKLIRDLAESFKIISNQPVINYNILLNVYLEVNLIWTEYHTEQLLLLNIDSQYVHINDENMSASFITNDYKTIVDLFKNLYNEKKLSILVSEDYTKPLIGGDSKTIINIYIILFSIVMICTIILIVQIFSNNDLKFTVVF